MHKKIFSSRVEKSAPKRLHRLSLVVAWILIVVGAIGMILVTVFDTRQPEPPSVVSVNAPSTVKPSRKAVSSYTVAPDLPKYIEIPAISVPKSRVMQLGLMTNNEIATPNNIYDAGWYKGSAKPGKNGAMFIFGHVVGLQAAGIFYNLKNLRSGDRIIITRGDNKHFTYQVVSSKVYPHDKVDMQAVLSPVDPSKPGLNLMTCAGQIMKGTHQFSERLVIFTSLVGS